MKKIHLLILFVSQCTFLISQDLDYIENKGQWNKEVSFLTEITGGRVFINKNELVYDYYSLKDLEKVHHHDNDDHDHDHTDHVIKCHNYRVNFINSNQLNFSPSTKRAYKYNYFIGNEENWASNVPLYQELYAKDIYSGIDLKLHSSNKNFKYDLIVKPYADHKLIGIQYEGAESLYIKEGKLFVKTSFHEVIEQKPYVYQVVDNKRVEIEAAYILKGNTIIFQIGDYDKSKNLIIDPTLIASTYSGSTSTIYGHTATFDSSGNIYSAGAGFSPGGLPITPGAYQTTYAGSREMCINKYNTDGTSLIYATYLGGSSNDYPHSLYDYNDKLYILGTSESTNFPTTSGAYDQSFNGNSDITVSILDQTGSTLLASTYVGGSLDDGINNIFMNYGDAFRGEIVADNNGNCYVSSMTVSTNFPTTGGAFQTANGGSQDGVAFKLNSTLTSLDFSTYLGGSGDDACYGVKVDGTKTYISGTAANNFITANGGAFPTHSGQNDGYILALNANASSILYASYFGTSNNEQAFFVEIDRYSDIYILGQTDGTINATPGVYSGGDKVFIAKFNNDLSTHQYTTTTGSMAPVAFLVDDCDYIYASGHGGVGTLTGFDITSNAIQSNPAGFYLMALNPGALSLNFGTYYGSSNSHVDGGTSRFDKKGTVYQATCSNNGFPTMPGAYSANNQTGGSYDVTVFKIDFELGALPAVFGPFPEKEDFTFDVNGCFDIVAFGGFSNAEVFLDIQSDAFPLGLYATLPPQKTNGLYDFNYVDTNGSSPVSAIDYDVIQHSPTSFEGVGNVGARICWNPDDCDVFLQDSYNVTLISLAMRCDSTIDSLVRNLTINVNKDTANPFVPNVFSPNGDGKNDFFELPEFEHDRCYDNLNIKIYNRWGTLVYESDDPLFKWDGTNTNGKPLNQGTYYAFLEGFFGNENVSDVFPVTLYR